MPRAAQKRKSKSKRTKINKKNLRNLKRYIALSGIFIVSSLFLTGYLAYKKVTSELAGAFSANTNDIVNEDIFTVLYVEVIDLNADPLIAKSIDFKIYDKNNPKMIEYQIPVTINIDAPGRYGEEPLSNILALGSLSGSDNNEGAEILAGAIGKLLAFPVNRYVVVEEEQTHFINDLFSGRVDLTGNIPDLYKVKSSIVTNLSLRELFNIYSFATSLPVDRVLEKELTQTYLENPALLDEEFMDLTFDSVLSNEKKSIAILNGSEIAGVANYGSRIVKNVGGRVVTVGNTKDTYEKSVLIVDNMTAESTRIVKNLFNINNVVLKSSARDYPESEINRSDITVIFGLDFAASL